MKKIFTFLVLAAFLLAACTGAEQVSDTEISAADEVVAELEPSVEESESEPTPTEVVESTAADNASSTEPELIAADLVSECTVVSALPEASAEYAELFAVREDDWVVGPEDATVTLIEYGDFQ
jgi:hypothetical protein